MYSREYKTRGFIIARRKQGETSKVITVVTKDFGRKSLIVKSARTSKCKTSGLVEPFMLVDLVASDGKSFDNLKEISLVKDYKILEKSLAGFGAGNILVEILDKISRWQEDFDAYSLLLDYLHCYERNKLMLSRYEKVMVYLSSFIMSVLAMSGRLPVVDSCCLCGLDVSGGNIVMIGQGVCHNKCLENSEYYTNISKTCQWWLQKIVLESCDVVLGHDCDHKTAGELFEVSMFLFRTFFEKELKSSFFLNSIFNIEEN